MDLQGGSLHGASKQRISRGERTWVTKTADTVGKNVFRGLQGLSKSNPVRNIEQSKNERNAAAKGCTTNTNTALSAMLPDGLPTGITPHHTAAPMPGSMDVMTMAHLQEEFFFSTKTKVSSLRRYNLLDKKEKTAI
jgi:hypothetical protein